MTRTQMIQALTKYELQYLIDNPELLDDMADFFANGGFDNVNIDDLEDAYKDRFLNKD